MVFAIEEQDPHQIEYFEFTVPGVFEGKSKTKLEVHRLPLMQYLGVELVEKMESGGLAEMLDIFGGNAAAVRRLNGRQLSALMRAWREASAVGTGESAAS